MRDYGVVAAEISAPSGLVTFLFTDVEGSTGLWAAEADAMSASLLVHDEVLRGRIAASGGYVFTTAGDSFCAAFARPSDALAAAEKIQAELARVAWPGPQLRVRMGLHLGEAVERGGDYFGPAVNTAARVEAAGHGGQILMTEAVRLAAGVEATDLGVHELRDVGEPLRLYQFGGGRFGALRVASVSSTNLPAAVTSLVGRADDVQAVRTALLSSRLVTLTAGGGIGKTRLAVAVGELELPEREDGVWFADLTPLADGAQVATAVAEGLGLSLYVGDVVGQIGDYLADKDLLLVIDNCEHVLDEVADLVEELIRRPGRYAILATSREPLDVEGEVGIGVRPLSTNDESSAVELFRQRAEAVDARFSLSGGNRDAVSELCRRLDGVPLAIELAAARSAAMSPRELLAGIEDRFQLLHGGRRRQRQRTLEATLDWSYELLDHEEQRLFRALGVFVGTFDADAAGSVIDDDEGSARRLMESLIAKSLVIREEISGLSRYRLFETTAAYAERRLSDAGEAAAVRGRHLGHFLEIARQYPAAMEADLGARGAIRNDKANLVAAIDWAGSTDRWPMAAELLLRVFAVFFAHPAEGIELGQRCVDAVDDTDLTLPLTSGLYTLHLLVSDIASARACLRRLRESRTPLHQTYGYGYLAVLRAGANPAGASEVLARAFKCAERIETGSEAATAATAMCHQAAASIAMLRLDPDAALELNAQSIELHEQLDYRSDSYAHAVMNSAVCALMTGDPDKAVESADLYHQLSPAFGTGNEIRALAYVAQGDFQQATTMARVHARAAVTGRFPLQASDTILVLASLADAEQEEGAAREFLLGMGLCRTLELSAYARHLAETLGVREEFDRSQREILAAPDELVGRAAAADIATLQQEMQRRDWS